MTTLPKIIWSYWEQGRHNAPQLVQRCLESWEYWHPDWTVRVLDRETISQYTDLEQRIDLSREDITIQKRSNMLRVALLRAHGGVWADSTVMCSQPLETWLPEYFSSGFFSFRNPGRDRLWSSWFIVAEPENLLMATLEERYVGLFADTKYTMQNTLSGDVCRRILKPFLTRNVRCTRIYISDWFRKSFKIYPYFNVQYTFNNIVLGGGEAAEVWHQAKPYEVGNARRVRLLRKIAGGQDKAQEFILAQHCGVHKLDWRSDIDAPYWRNVFDCFEQLRQ